MEIYVKQLGRRNVDPSLIAALARGIGVHHAGMNRKYRQVCEILFRKGFLRVVIATGTLALGINMPCKTVVFSGDSVFLTALNYRQCAGRAGRRGFDLLGNVVFQGLSREKVCRLLSSRLPDLNGHFPITTTLVLRLFTLLHESKNAKYAVGAINGLLSQPRMYLGGASFKDQTMRKCNLSICTYELKLTACPRSPAFLHRVPAQAIPARRPRRHAQLCRSCQPSVFYREFLFRLPRSSEGRLLPRALLQRQQEREGHC